MRKKKKKRSQLNALKSYLFYSYMSIISNGEPEILSPPELFAIVEPNVYRTKQIYPHNFSFIKQLKLKTLVKLTPEEPFKAVASFCDDNNIDLVSSWNWFLKESNFCCFGFSLKKR